MVEYILVLAAMLLLATVLGYVIVAANRHADEIVTLVTQDCP